MIDKNAMLENIERKRYENDHTGYISIGYALFGSGLADSAVANAVAKETSFAFEYALKNGVYANHSIFGGNFLYNSLYNSFVSKKLFNSLNTAKSFSHSLPFGLSFNFMSNHMVDDGAELATRIKQFDPKISPTSEVLRTGIGIGKNRKETLNFLKEIIPDGKIDESLMKNWNKYDLKSFLEKQIYKNTFDKINPKSALRTVVELDDKAFGEFMNFIVSETGVIDDSVLSLHNVRLAMRSGKYYDPVAAGKLENKFKDELTDFLLNHKMSGGVSDAIAKLFKKYDIKTSGKITKHAVSELSEKIAGEFAEKTLAQKVLSTKFVKTAVGFRSGVNPVTATITTASIIASFGQDNAINNFINKSLYNTSLNDGLISDEAKMAAYSSHSISDFNLRNLSLALGEINTANNYMNDYDPMLPSTDSYHSENFK